MIPAPPRDARPRLVAFGNVAVGFIAIGNVAIGVVAIGFTVSVGPIAIGMNALGILLGVGLNAAGTLALAAINGLGAITHAFVNAGQSVVVAVLSLCAQLGAAFFLANKAPTPNPTGRDTVRLSEITSGVRAGGLVRARIVALAGDGVTIEEDAPDKTRASLTLTGFGRPMLGHVQSSDGAVLVSIRATTEAVQSSAEMNYRVAPEVSRVLWAEGFEALPAPPPLWARPGIVRSASRASAFVGAALSALEIARQLLLG